MSSIGSILGSFSKGIDGSVTINFARSGGIHCDRSCAHHPQSTAARPTCACYGVRTEYRPDRCQLAAKLERHEKLPPAVIIPRQASRCRGYIPASCGQSRRNRCWPYSEYSFLSTGCDPGKHVKPSPVHLQNL